MRPSVVTNLERLIARARAEPGQDLDPIFGYAGVDQGRAIELTLGEVRVGTRFERIDQNHRRHALSVELRGPERAMLPSPKQQDDRIRRDGIVRTEELREAYQ